MKSDSDGESDNDEEGSEEEEGNYETCIRGELMLIKMAMVDCEMTSQVMGFADVLSMIGSPLTCKKVK